MRQKRQPRSNPRGSDQAVFSCQERGAQAWTSAQPAGPVRRVDPAEIARMERVRADRRLEKEFRAYDKLEEINERWRRRQQ